MFNVAQLKESVAGLLTGVNLNNITNLDTALSRAARYVAQKVDAPDATGREPFTLYGGVYYYPAPDNLFGTAINLIRRQGDASSPLDYNYKVPMDVFTRGKYNFPNGYMLDVEYDKGQGIIGVSSPIPIPQLVLSTMGEGSDWTAGGSASQAVTDPVNYYQPPASIRFNLTGNSTGTQTATIQATDITTYDGVGMVFLAINDPDTVNTADVVVKIGSSPTDYYQIDMDSFLTPSVTNEIFLPNDTFALMNGSLADATEVGSVDVENIDYLEVSIETTATITNIRLGGLWISYPSQNEIIFQTAAIFKDATGALSNTITSDNNEIILNQAAYSILELECAKTIALQQSGGQYTSQIKGFDEILMGQGDEPGLYNLYRADNPSNELRQVDTYYADGGYNYRW